VGTRPKYEHTAFASYVVVSHNNGYRPAIYIHFEADVYVCTVGIRLCLFEEAVARTIGGDLYDWGLPLFVER